MAEWTFKRDTAFRKQFFVPDSFAHPAKMDAQLLIKIVETYTLPGEVILDPMAGSGTLMLACMMGRHCLLIELEEKFCKMCRDNWEIVRMHPQLGYEMGTCQIIQGDARNLEGLLADKIITSPPFGDAEHNYKHGLKTLGKNFQGRKAWETKGVADKIITSPPYAEQKGEYHNGTFIAKISGDISDKCKSGKIKGHYASKEAFERAWAKRSGLEPDSPDNIANLPYGQVSKIITSPPYAEVNQMPRDNPDPTADKQGRANIGKQYSSDPDNLGNLPYGNIDSIITSPPYEGQDTTGGDAKGMPREDTRLCTAYSENPSNIGNLKSTTYLEAMLQVYKQCLTVLKDGGLMILVTKNFIRNKQVIRLDADTIKLCEEAGFGYLHRHYRKLPSQSFWRILYHKKHPEVEQILYEDILVFKKC